MNATELNQTELDSLKDSLLLQKSVILNKTHEFKAEQSNVTASGDEAEVASIDSANHVSIQLNERHRNSLYAIERALGKISEQTYGSCESCGEYIGAKRLKARPFTALCIECMEDQENSRNLFQ